MIRGSTLSRNTTIAYIVIALMLSTAVVYFIVASEAYIELSHSVSSSISSPSSSSSKEELEDMMGTTNEVIFFTIVGIAYAVVAVWMLENKRHDNKVLYVIATIGSLALIILYIISRTVNLPLIGFEEDIGSLDILSKVLQAGIIIGSVIVIKIQYKEQKQRSATSS